MNITRVSKSKHATTSWHDHISYVKLDHSPSCQNSLSSSGRVTQSFWYMTRALLPANCFLVPYPITLASPKKARNAVGFSRSFLVNHGCGRAGFCSAGGSIWPGVFCGDGVEDAEEEVDEVVGRLESLGAVARVRINWGLAESLLAVFLSISEFVWYFKRCERIERGAIVAMDACTYHELSATFRRK